MESGEPLDRETELGALGRKLSQKRRPNPRLARIVTDSSGRPQNGANTRQSEAISHRDEAGWVADTSKPAFCPGGEEGFATYARPEEVQRRVARARDASGSG